MSDTGMNGIPTEKVTLKPEGLNQTQRNEVFTYYRNYLNPHHNNFMGYQTNQDLKEEEPLAPFLKLHVNNIGDPWAAGGFMLNSKQMEGALLDYFGSLWHVKAHNKDDPESLWGYVLSMGSTEGNMYGLWQARDYLQGKTLYHEPNATYAAAARNSKARGATMVPLTFKSGRGRFATRVGTEDNSRTPICFFSEDTHYSITKICRVLDLPTFYDVGTEKYPSDCPLGGEWPQTVPSTEDGTVDVPSLLKLVEFFASKGYPPLVVFNMGSTFKCAYDPVDTAGAQLVAMLRKYGLDQRKVEYADGKFDIRTGYWIHVDGALGGTYVPLIHLAKEKGKYNGPMPPKFDFALPFVHSINTSGHKWPGVPWPCGVFLTKVKYQIKPPSDPVYISSPDTTFAGSRNGFSAIILWDFYARLSIDNLIDSTLGCLNLSAYAFTKLSELSKTLGAKYGQPDNKDFLWVARSPAALTVRLRCPIPDLIAKYSLSTESMYVDVDGETYQRNYCHIYMMYHSTNALVDQFVADLQQDGAIDPDGTEIPQSIQEISDGNEYELDVRVLRSALPIYSISDKPRPQREVGKAQQQAAERHHNEAQHQRQHAQHAGQLAQLGHAEERRGSNRARHHNARGF